MFRINRGQIDGEAKGGNAKQVGLSQNHKVFDAVKLVFLNLVDEILKFKVYDAAHWACNIDRWIDNLNTDNRITYKRGEIVFLDLGAQNFGHEPSYTHACIVLQNRNNSILVVPCSTKKYGKGYSDIIDATPSDGFMKNTGIQSESFRWVSKNRVVSRPGNQVTPSILDKLDEVLVSFAPSNKKTITQMRQEISDLKDKVSELQSKIENDSQKTPK